MITLRVEFSTTPHIRPTRTYLSVSSLHLSHIDRALSVPGDIRYLIQRETISNWLLNLHWLRFSHERKLTHTPLQSARDTLFSQFEADLKQHLHEQMEFQFRDHAAFITLMIIPAIRFEADIESNQPLIRDDLEINQWLVIGEEPHRVIPGFEHHSMRPVQHPQIQYGTRITLPDLNDLMHHSDVDPVIQQQLSRIHRIPDQPRFIIEHENHLYTMSVDQIWTDFPVLAETNDLLSLIKPDTIESILIHRDAYHPYLNIRQPKIDMAQTGTGEFLEFQLEARFGANSLPLIHLERMPGNGYIETADHTFWSVGKSFQNRVQKIDHELKPFRHGSRKHRIHPTQLVGLKRKRPDINWSALRLKDAWDKPAPHVRPDSLPGVTLATHQVYGANWLIQRWSSGTGALLADQMGLGKTLQVIAVLSAIEFEHALIVAPNSVTGQWQAELETRLPEKTARITVTHYEQLHRPELHHHSFQIAIFDEAQYLKHPKTQRYTWAEAIDADVKIGLTGTPIENDLSDLHAVFHLLCPGLLGSADWFNERIRQPYQRAYQRQDGETLKTVSDLIQSLINPFMLRRLKSDVELAVSLPEKHVEVIQCELHPRQTELIRAAMAEFRSSGGIEKRFFDAKPIYLTLILRLKQICNHPWLVSRNTADFKLMTGKLIELKRILGEQFEARRKTIIFSQFRETINYLDARIRDEFGYPTVVMTGETYSDVRDEIIQEFTESKLPVVFLISLKTGGVGLNLTAADTVIHFDRWWNPAVEDQASDRIHRIGQTEDVTIIHLITTNSIESYVHQVIDQKQHLSQLVIDVDHDWLKQWSTQAFIDLATSEISMPDRTN